MSKMPTMARIATTLWLSFVGVAACLAHVRPGYESNFSHLRLTPEGILVERDTGTPYSGRLVARDQEVSAVGCAVVTGTPLAELCHVETSGLILEAAVQGGRLQGPAALHADVRSNRVAPQLEERLGDLAGLARAAVPTVQVATATFVDGELHGPVQLLQPRPDAMPRSVLAEATFVHNRLEGTARQFVPGTTRVERELVFVGGARSGPQRSYFDDGALAEVRTYEGGQLHGPQVAYYADGSLRQRETFSRGEHEGISEAWFPDHTPKRRETFDGSEPRLQQWYSNGALALEVRGLQTQEFPPDGLIVEYYASGRVHSRVHYEHGVRHGEFEVFYRDGSRWERGTYVAGALEGTHEKWWNNGRLALREHHVEGQLDGPYVRDYAEGTRWERATYHAGKRVGAYRKWWKNGALAHEYTYVEGKLHGPYRTYYDSGAAWAVAEYASGKPLGVHKRWFPDGRLGYIKHHVAGRPEGAHRRWYADGTLRLDATYRGGKLDGEFRNWLEDGSVYELATYDRGKKLTSTLPAPEGGDPASTAASLAVAPAG
jgi:antitoxin component YwqK of YwqJK toxin-antitoxin module